MARTLKVDFYMTGGHVVTALNVKSASMSCDPTTGRYDGYRIVWYQGKQPSMFSLSIPDIVAVVADVDPYGQEMED